MSDSADSRPSAPSVPELLLALQAVDTEVDQLAHRRRVSPLRTDFETASAQLTAWERTRQQLTDRIDELGRVIEESEATGEELRSHRSRLEQQLKTVIAPREAEALMHEIATIDQQSDDLDTAEMAALEEQSDLDDARRDHLADQETVTTAVRHADTALAEEVAQIETALADLNVERDRLRSLLDDSLLSIYDRKRAALGVAVAPLVGTRCQGCHLDLSAAEIDTIKQEAATTGVTDCPDCGRLLIV